MYLWRQSSLVVVDWANIMVKKDGPRPDIIRMASDNQTRACSKQCDVDDHIGLRGKDFGEN